MVFEAEAITAIQNFGFPAVAVYLILRLETTFKENTAMLWELKYAVSSCPKKASA